MPDAPPTIIANGSGSTPAAPPAATANGSGSTPASPVQIAANESGSTPATPPQVAEDGGVVTGMQVVIPGIHDGLSGFYEESGTNGGFPLYLFGPYALFVPDEFEQPDIVADQGSRWLFSEVWPVTDPAYILLTNDTDGAQATPDLQFGWYDIEDIYEYNGATVTAVGGVAAPVQITANGSSSTPAAPPVIV